MLQLVLVATAWYRHDATVQITAVPVGDDLVAVHVGLRSAPGLEHNQREVLVQLPLDHLHTYNFVYV